MDASDQEQFRHSGAADAGHHHLNDGDINDAMRNQMTGRNIAVRSSSSRRRSLTRPSGAVVVVAIPVWVPSCARGRYGGVPLWGATSPERESGIFERTCKKAHLR